MSSLAGRGLSSYLPPPSTQTPGPHHYNLEKKAIGHPEQCGQNDHKAERTAEKIAKETGVSAKTVRRDAKFAEGVDKLPPEEKKKVLVREAMKPHHIGDKPSQTARHAFLQRPTRGIFEG